MLGPFFAGEIASRREAMVEVRAKLIQWGEMDWDTPARKSK
jgi:hypothetical protein